MKKWVTLSIMFLGLALGKTGEAAEKSHGIAMHGDLKYGPDFTHFEYVNPDAPKGGKIKVHAFAPTFDSLNPFALKGVAASGIGALVYESLMASSVDEAFSKYGLIAQTVEVPEDRSWVGYELNPKARWHDGQPITADDVVFSFETLMAKGAPIFQFYYSGVDRVEKTGDMSVKFHFKSTTNRELVMIVGQLPVIPKHYWENRDFEATTLEPPLGSGPYKVKTLDQGRSITYERVAEYWGADLPVNKGLYNFDEIQVDYYRDSTVRFEAFKGGAFDFNYETTAKTWATGYDIPEVKKGEIIKYEFAHEVGTGMQAFVFNIRRPIFQDPRVREALGYAFDFEWSNKNLFNGQYARTESYFSNSELASTALPQGRELEILEAYRGKIPDTVFTTEFKTPKSDGSGNIRPQLKQAIKLLKEAGYGIKDRKMVNLQTGEPLTFEMLLLANPVWDRIALPFKKNLERLGIDMTIRSVDTAQYKERTDTFDYDMIVDAIGQSSSPGNEQYDFWTSTAAKREGSRNSIGIENPVIDELVDLVVHAPDRDELVARVRALDRVLLSYHYVIPHWHSRVARIAAWDKFGMPAVYPKYDRGYTLWHYWWLDPQKAEKLQKR